MKTSAASTAGRNADLIPYQSDTILADAMDDDEDDEDDD